MGLDPGNCSSVTILGRVVSMDRWGIHYETDSKHRKLILEHFGLENGGKGLSVNGEKECHDTEEDLEQRGIEKFAWCCGPDELLELRLPGFVVSC